MGNTVAQPRRPALGRSRTAAGHSHSSNVYVKLLPPCTTDKDLHALGSAYGRVRSVKTIYLNEAATQPALASASSQLSSCSQPSSSSAASSPTPSGDKLRVRTTNLTDDEFTGERVCKGCGFILFATGEEATHAVSQLRARGFEASFAKADSPALRLRQLSDEENTNLYIANLPPAMSEEQLAEMLAPLAEVHSIRLMREYDTLPAQERIDRGASRGVGFARVASREEAERVIGKLNNAILQGSNLPLKVRFSDTAGQKLYKAELTTARAGRAPPASTTTHIQPARREGSWRAPSSGYSLRSPVSPTRSRADEAGSWRVRTPPRFANSGFPAQLSRSASTPLAARAQLPATTPVAHKPKQRSMAEISLAIPSSPTPIRLSATAASFAVSAHHPRPVNLAPIEAPPSSCGAAVGEGGEPSPPLAPTHTPSSSPPSTSNALGLSLGVPRHERRASAGSASLLLASIPEGSKSAEPTRTSFARREDDGGVDVAEGLRRRTTWAGKKRDMYAARKSLP